MAPDTSFIILAPDIRHFSATILDLVSTLISIFLSSDCM